MLENICPKGEKYTKVEQKLELLAHSKLRNVTQNNLKVLEERVANMDKSLSEEIMLADRNSKDGVT
jgi:hypothetical protein